MFSASNTRILPLCDWRPTVLNTKASWQAEVKCLGRLSKIVSTSHPQQTCCTQSNQEEWLNHWPWCETCQYKACKNSQIEEILPVKPWKWQGIYPVRTVSWTSVDCFKGSVEVFQIFLRNVYRKDQNNEERDEGGLGKKKHWGKKKAKAKNQTISRRLYITLLKSAVLKLSLMWSQIHSHNRINRVWTVLFCCFLDNLLQDT